MVKSVSTAKRPPCLPLRAIPIAKRRTNPAARLGLPADALSDETTCAESPGLGPRHRQQSLSMVSSNGLNVRSARSMRTAVFTAHTITSARLADSTPLVESSSARHCSGAAPSTLCDAEDCGQSLCGRARRNSTVGGESRDRAGCGRKPIGPRFGWLVVALTLLAAHRRLWIRRRSVVVGVQRRRLRKTSRPPRPRKTNAATQVNSPTTMFHDPMPARGASP